MRRRDLVTLLVGGALMWPHDGTAQQERRPRRVIYFSLATPEGDRPWVAAFLGGLRELGHVEGENVVVEQHHAGGRPENLPALVRSAMHPEPDVLVAFGGVPVVRAVREAHGTVPIVFTVSPDPVGDGLVASLARPGGTVTGLSDLHGGMITKRLELLKEVMPSVNRVAVLYAGRQPSSQLQLDELEAAAPSFGVILHPIQLGGPGADDIDAAFMVLRRERFNALLVIPDASFSRFRSRVTELATEGRIAVIGTGRQFAEAGALMSYGANFTELWRRAAVYVDKILKGASPAELPVEQATSFELVVNLKTAKALGIEIPPALLARADEVIE